jgi:uncharacterized protein (TIGR00251 family)
VKVVAVGEAVRFSVHARPRAKKSRIGGERGEALEVAIAAPPVEGAANDELVRALAEALSLPRRDVRIVRGEGSRSKVVEVRGLGVDEVRARLARATVER